MDLAKLWQALSFPTRTSRRKPGARRREPRRFIGIEPLESRHMLSVSLLLNQTSMSEGSGSALLFAELSAALENDVTLDLLMAGTAVKDSDYTISAQSLTIPAGSLSASVTLYAVDNSIYQGDRTIVATMANLVGDTAGEPQEVTATILEDEAAPAVSLALADSPLAENGGSATVTASLSVATSETVTVALAFSGTAVKDGQYTASATSISIPAGSTSASITLTGIDDSVYTGDQTIVVDVASVNNATEDGDQQVTATRSDDETAVVATLAIADSSIAETGGSTIVTASLSSATTLDVTVDLAFGGTAVKDSHYTASATSITIAAGSTTGSITLAGIDDSVYSGSRTILVDIDSVTNASENGTQRVSTSLTDDETAILATLAVADSSFSENGGSTTVTAGLSAISTLDVTVNLAFTGTALIDGQYTASATSIVILAGNTTGSITLAGIDDSVYTGSRTIVVDIDSVTNGVEDGTQQVTTTRTDDDTAILVTLAIADSSISENGGSTIVTATLSEAPVQDVTITWAFSGTATLGTRYSATAETLTIAAGSTSGSITLTGIDDSVYEDPQTIIVEIADVTNALEDGTQLVSATLTDDDSSPTVALSLSGSSLSENGGTTTLTATLSAAAGADVTVELSFSGTAVQDTDYSVSATSIVIAAGSTTGSITLTGIDNSTADGDRTIVVDISYVTNASEADEPAVTATLTDDENAVPDAPTDLTLATSSQFDGHASFTLSATPTIVLSAATGKTVTVLVNGTSAVTATESGDGQYTATIPTGYLMVGANSITAVAGDSVGDSATSTAFTLTYAPSFTQIYVIPGTVGAAQTITVTLTSRLAAYRNEVGYIVADDASGAVDSLAPGASGFAEAAMNKAVVLFAGSAEEGATQTITVSGGQYLVFYLVQNNSASQFLTDNPDNALSGDVVTFFSVDAANPDSVRHTSTVGDATTGNVQYGWEDLAGGGDSDYNDLVISLAPSTTSGQTGAALRVPGESTETVSATFTLQSAQKSGSQDNSSGTLAGEVGIFYVTDTSGSVDGLTPDDDGYIAAALASDNRVTLFSAGTSFDAQNTQSLNGGSLIAFYAINTGSADDFLTDNSANATSGSAVAFVSFDTANSDSANHFRWYGAEQVSCIAPTANSTCDTRLLHVMTAIFGGDLDFDDYTIKVELS